MSMFTIEKQRRLVTDKSTLFLDRAFKLYQLRQLRVVQRSITTDALRC